MAYELRYHPEVADDDLPKLPANMRERVARAIETRIATEPGRYGSPLRGTLRGYWKLRVGDYRVVFKVTGSEVLVLAVMHRRRVYQEVGKRAGSSPVPTAARRAPRGGSCSSTPLRARRCGRRRSPGRPLLMASDEGRWIAAGTEVFHFIPLADPDRRIVVQIPGASLVGWCCADLR